jgi:hypothetical protein
MLKADGFTQSWLEGLDQIWLQTPSGTFTVPRGWLPT